MSPMLQREEKILKLSSSTPCRHYNKELFADACIISVHSCILFVHLLQTAPGAFYSIVSLRRGKTKKVTGGVQANSDQWRPLLCNCQQSPLTMANTIFTHALKPFAILSGK